MAKSDHKKSHKSDSSKESSKTKFFVIGAVIGVCLLLFTVFWIFHSPTVAAQLLVHSGVVQVDQGNGYVAVTGQMELSVSDKIKTLEGEASVILYESIVIDLEEATEIAIDVLTQKHPKISQLSGSTWNKFAKITGVETLTLTTPNTVATVRGTFFGLRDQRLLLSDGAVDWTAGGRLMSHSGLQKTTFIDGAMRRAEITTTDIGEIQKRKIIMAKHLKTLRELEVRKHKTLLKLIQKRYGWDVDEVLSKLEALDNNQVDLDEIERNAPMKLAVSSKLKAITQEIRRLKQLSLQ